MRHAVTTSSQAAKVQINEAGWVLLALLQCPSSAQDTHLPRSRHQPEASMISWAQEPQQHLVRSTVRYDDHAAPCPSSARQKAGHTCCWL